MNRADAAEHGPPPGAADVSGIYLHVPFCASDCAYCAFAREVPRSRADIDAYLDALARECAFHAGRLERPIAPETMYVGGGTPTFLTPAEWDRLEAALRPLVSLEAVRELTVEANPESATPERLERLVRFGMTRLSLGAQALGGDTLSLLGRTHDFARVVRAVDDARRHEGLVVSLDLIYGVPGLTESAWSRTLDAVLGLRPDHLSAYCLSFEEGSSLSARRREGRLAPPDDAEQRRAYDLLVRRAEAAGLARYEVSNFGTSRGRSRHNLTYWEGRTYLGLGPSAHSHVDGWRLRNHTHRRRWETALRAGEGPVAERERIGPRERAAEHLMRLRVVSGAPGDRLPPPGGPFGRRVAELEGEGLLVRAGGASGQCLCLAPDAFFLCDGIVSDLLAAWEEEPDGFAHAAAGSGAARAGAEIAP